MTPDGFLSVLSIAIAVYALMTPVQKMQARLSLHMQALLAMFFLCGVIYLELFDTLQQSCGWSQDLCNALRVDPPRTLSAQQMAFALILLWLVLAVNIHRFTRPSAAALSTFGKIVDQLLMDRRYDNLIVFLTPHMKFLTIGAERRFLFQALHDWLGGFAPYDPKNIFRVPRGPEQESRIRHWLPDGAKSSIAWLHRVVPSEARYEEIATDILVRLARSDDLRMVITRDRPYFAFSIFDVKFRERFEFANAYFRDLMADPNSVFYQEMKVGLSLSWTEGFNLEPYNHLQNYLLKDCRVADDLSVYKPIGDYVEELIGGEHDADYVQKLNGPKTATAEYRDPTLNAISFFDIMVRRAAFQNVRSHMWLMYLTHFVERVEDVSALPPTSNEGWQEFPTFGAYLIYQVFDTLGDWVHLVRDLPETSSHIQFNNRDLVSIPVFAAEALGRSLKRVLASDRLAEGFKTYMLEAVMYDIKNLFTQGIQGEARAMLIAHIIGGGVAGHDVAHHTNLHNYLGSTEYSLRSDVPDFVEAVWGK